MSTVERAKREILERFERRLQKEIRAQGGGDVPPWVKAGMALINQSRLHDPLRPPIVSVQPMTQPVGGITFYRPRYGSWEPSAVDRLAALAEPDSEMAKRIAEYDEQERRQEEFFRRHARAILMLGSKDERREMSS